MANSAPASIGTSTASAAAGNPYGSASWCRGARPAADSKAATGAGTRKRARRNRAALVRRKSQSGMPTRAASARCPDRSAARRRPVRVRAARRTNRNAPKTADAPGFRHKVRRAVVFLEQPEWRAGASAEQPQRRINRRGGAREPTQLDARFGKPGRVAVDRSAPRDRHQHRRRSGKTRPTATPRRPRDTDAGRPSETEWPRRDLYRTRPESELAHDHVLPRQQDRRGNMPQTQLAQEGAVIGPHTPAGWCGKSSMVSRPSTRAPLGRTRTAVMRSDSDPRGPAISIPTPLPNAANFSNRRESLRRRSRNRGEG